LVKLPHTYTIFVALGSNLGDGGLNPADTVKTALGAIDTTLGHVTRRSGLYTTPCFPVGAGPDFVNAVAQVDTPLAAGKCLQALHEIETHFGRTRNVRWDARTLDLDLLDHNSQILPDLNGYRAWLDMPLEQQKSRAPDQLILPHPRIQDRGFVLVPWAEIAPDWCHPVIGKTTVQMRDALPAQDLAEITAISSA
jgi:2-amino-4-hydroxy-6-hydroxymethyldihydropteridine diphosphokinase